jgi:hypothetical protein
MAGSQTWRTYTDDTGTNWSIPIAKHLADCVVLTTIGQTAKLCETRGTAYPELPCTIEKRYVLMSLIYINEGIAGFVPRKIRNAKRVRVVVGNRSAIPYLLSSVLDYCYFTDPGNINASAWSPTFYSGEKRSINTLDYSAPT